MLGVKHFNRIAQVEPAMSRSDDVIACTVREFRQARGWSQQELAEKIGVKRQAVYDIETGRYLPNTGIALRLARLFGCRVEDLFVDREPEQVQVVQMLDGASPPSSRIALARVRERLVGLPLQGPDAMSFGFRSADGLLSADGKHAQIFSSPEVLEKTIILMGCDPAFEILGQHVNRLVTDGRVLCRFASSRRSLTGVAQGMTHVAGTHFHNTGQRESNVLAASHNMGDRRCRVVGFSILEEGLMVARGNPLEIRTVADLARPKLRFINRESGAALRTLLDDHLQRSGLAPDAIHGFRNEVASHQEGACRVACNVADAALGLRAVAEAFHLGFVPIAAVRCDLLLPDDLIAHPTVKILLDVLNSSALRREIDSLPGYESAVTGRVIAEL